MQFVAHYPHSFLTRFCLQSANTIVGTEQRIGLLFTHKNGDSARNSVTKRCNAPIIYHVSHMSDRCSHYTGSSFSSVSAQKAIQYNVHIHRLRLNSEHYSRRTRRVPLSFITSYYVRERESVHSFIVTPSKLLNNVHGKFRTSGLIDGIFFNKDCTGVSVLFKTSTCSIRHFM